MCVLISLVGYCGVGMPPRLLEIRVRQSWSYVVRCSCVLCMGGFCCTCVFFFFSSRRRHTRSDRDWSSDVCSSDLPRRVLPLGRAGRSRLLDGGRHVRRGYGLDRRPPRGTRAPRGTGRLLPGGLRDRKSVV